MITIDGSQGEGGGQILRTSLALSLVTGRPVRFTRIRAGRKRPGLMRQHLTAVEAAARIGRAQTAGAQIGSQELSFVPKQVVAGAYHFAVGTAGSATLVLQTVLPALLTAGGQSTLTLEGGTHNPFAPPFDFLARCFLPLVNRMGPRVTATLNRPGFFPAGGGRFEVKIEPTDRLDGFELMDRGEIIEHDARVLISKLPRHIAEREPSVIQAELGWPDECISIDEVTSSPGPGNVVMIEMAAAAVTEICTAFGERGVPAEAVARKAIRQARDYLSAGVPVGEHLADQLLLPLALAGAGAFRTVEPSLHTRTNIAVIESFLDIPVATEKEDGGAWRIDVRRLIKRKACGSGEDM